MTKLVLDKLTGQQKGVYNRLWAALVSSIERIVRNMVRSLQTIAEVTEAVIDNPRFISPTGTLVKS